MCNNNVVTECSLWSQCPPNESCACQRTLRTSQLLQLCCSYPGTMQTNVIHWQERGRVVIQNVFQKTGKIAIIFRSLNQKKNAYVD